MCRETRKERSEGEIMDYGRIGRDELLHLANLLVALQSVRQDLSDVSRETVDELMATAMTLEATVRRAIAELDQIRGQ